MINKHSLGIFYKLLKLYSSNTNLKNNSVTILTYHNIPDLHKENFKSQIKWINKNYNIISPNEFESFICGNLELNKHSILITFDDGFLSSYDVTQTYLNPLNIKSLFFIPSMFISENRKNWNYIISEKFFNGKVDPQNFPNDLNPMTNDNITELLKQGHKIGAHTNSHSNISKIKSNELINLEIINPIKIFSDKLNIDVDSFAFPYGRINHINSKVFRKIVDSYNYCYSNIRGSNNKNTSKFAIRRQNVSPDMPIGYLGFIIEGGLDFYWYKNSKKLKLLASDISYRNN